MNQINGSNLCCLPFWSQLTTQPARPFSEWIAHLFNTNCLTFNENSVEILPIILRFR
ncbi:MAG: hypothetical protein LBL62_07650 [Planctomycetaceae bacterium]|nr:hypothetical protein [Planctomycetaceae bacterium]